MTLSSLTPGDIFTHAKSKAKNPTRFIVKGNPIGAKRICWNLKSSELESKWCGLEVVKVGESKIKSKYMKLANCK